MFQKISCLVVGLIPHTCPTIWSNLSHISRMSYTKGYVFFHSSLCSLVNNLVKPNPKRIANVKKCICRFFRITARFCSQTFFMRQEGMAYTLRGIRYIADKMMPLYPSEEFMLLYSLKSNHFESLFTYFYSVFKVVSSNIAQWQIIIGRIHTIDQIYIGKRKWV